MGLEWVVLKSLSRVEVGFFFRFSAEESIDLRFNGLGDEGKGAIRDAVSGREGFKLKLAQGD